MSKPTTPTAILAQRGSWRAKIRKNEVKPEVILLNCPKGLNLKAQAKWKELSKQLYDLGVLTRLDQSALIRYCELWALYERLKKDDDQIVQLVKVCQLLKQLECEFGLTPSSRTKVRTEKPQKDDKTSERFFKVHNPANNTG